MRITERIKQLFCKHIYGEYLRKETYPFKTISGDRIYIMCEKCGHIKGSYFRRH